MINIIEEKKCCGCFACKESCPQKCISINCGSLGHFFPTVDQAKCINCGICNAVCPMENPDDNSFISKQSFIAQSRDSNTLFKSSSGGFFSTIASFFLKKGYIIYGSAFNERLKLNVENASCESEIDKLCKSKYLQSSFGDKYREIESTLKAGRHVLFCGTPCMVLALKKYLKHDYPNLFTVDFICHGVPSQEFFDRCKTMVENKRNIKILAYEFRTKIEKGVTPHYYTLSYQDSRGTIKSETKIYYKSPNYAAFQKYINLRESCYDCPFSTINRHSDITIGDFHNVNNYYKDVDRFKGVSIILTNTEQGESAFFDIKDQMNIYPISLQTIVMNKEIFQKTPRPQNRDLFISDYNTMEFDKFCKKWFNPKKYIKNGIYYSMPKWMRKITKKMVGQ